MSEREMSELEREANRKLEALLTQSNPVGAGGTMPGPETVDPMYRHFYEIGRGVGLRESGACSVGENENSFGLEPVRSVGLANGSSAWQLATAAMTIIAFGLGMLLWHSNQPMNRQAEGQAELPNVKTMADASAPDGPGNVQQSQPTAKSPPDAPSFSGFADVFASYSVDSVVFQRNRMVSMAYRNAPSLDVRDAQLGRSNSNDSSRSSTIAEMLKLGDF